MTEQDWLTCGDPVRMIRFLAPKRWSGRRGRLLAVECCRRLRTPSPDHRLAMVIDAAERFADDPTQEADLGAAIAVAHEVVEREARQDMASWQSHAAYVFVSAAMYPAEEYTAIGEFCDWATTEPGARGDPRLIVVRTLRGFANLVRELAGNPFRPVTIDPSWLTSTVVQLARGIYDKRAFDRLPILADALQEAGCESEDVLRHCRDPEGTHLRGCWVVDLVLGKG